MLEQAKSDVLILLDCCAAASSATGGGTGITEIIAACGFEAWAPGVGQHSFTRSLIDELKYLRRTSPFSTSLLHNKVLSRVKYWKPRYDSSARHQEMRKTPIYIVISNETRPRSIELEPRPPPLLTVTEDTLTANYTSSPDPQLHDSAFSSLSLSPDVSSTSGPASESSRSSVSEVWPDKNFECPKVLISVALEEEQWLSAPQWADWIRSVPGLVKYANVEGIYKSGSTLLLISVPIAVWNLIPPSSAISFIGFSKSPNLLKPSSTVRTAPHKVHGVNQRREDVDLSLNVKPMENEPSADEWVYAILHILARIINYSFTANQSLVPEALDTDPGTSWESLEHLCSWWRESAPQEFQPLPINETSATSFPHIR